MRSRAVLWITGIAGALLGVLVSVLIAFSDIVDDRASNIIATLLIGWSFLGVGLYAWRGRPDNRIGPLMIAVAFTWMVGMLNCSDLPLAFSIGLLVSSVAFAVVLHLLLAYPTGRLPSTAARVVVGIGYADVVVGSLLYSMFVRDPEGLDDPPRNLLLVADSPATADTVLTVVTLVGVATIAAGTALLLMRWRAATPTQRRSLAPLLWTGALFLAFVAVTLAADVLGIEDLESGFGGFAVLLLAAAPYAYLAGLLSTGWSRAALENERLHAELRARVAELQESRANIISFGLAERRRLERDLHDGAQQRLVALSLQVNLARAKLDDDPATAASLLDTARDELSRALDELRELARGIHPAILTDQGLGPAVTALAERSPVPVEIEPLPAERLPSSVEAAAYFVVSEALANVAKYARASHATVRVARLDGHAVVEVADDGVGGADPGRGTGLRGLADRVAALDGRLEIVSPTGRGTTVRADLPCASS